MCVGGGLEREQWGWTELRSAVSPCILSLEGYMEEKEEWWTGEGYVEEGLRYKRRREKQGRRGEAKK